MNTILNHFTSRLVAQINHNDVAAGVKLCDAVQVLAQAFIDARQAALAAQCKPYMTALIALAEAMDDYALQNFRQSGEPQYHNRQHAQEVLLAMMMLLEQEQAAQDAGWPSLTEQEKCLLMLAALGHDFMHPGGINQYPQQLEQISAQGVGQVMRQCGLSDADCGFVSQLILATEFSQVASLHQDLRDRDGRQALDSNLTAAILITEADILPSVLPEHGLYLANKLSEEWQRCGVIDKPDPSLKNNYQQFINSVHFSSPYAIRLGIEDLFKQQI